MVKPEDAVAPPKWRSGPDRYIPSCWRTKCSEVETSVARGVSGYISLVCFAVLATRQLQFNFALSSFGLVQQVVDCHCRRNQHDVDSGIGFDES